MVVKQVQPKTTPGQAPKGNLTYVAIVAMAVLAVLIVAIVVRSVLPVRTPSSQLPSQSQAPAGAPAR